LDIYGVLENRSSTRGDFIESERWIIFEGIQMTLTVKSLNFGGALLVLQGKVNE
jgi:hypothetical protein